MFRPFVSVRLYFIADADASRSTSSELEIVRLRYHYHCRHCYHLRKYFHFVRKAKMRKLRKCYFFPCLINNAIVLFHKIHWLFHSEIFHDFHHFHSFFLSLPVSHIHGRNKIFFSLEKDEFIVCNNTN